MATTCKQHTPCPEGYLAWHDWAEKKGKAHKQIRCDECGLYEIWVRKRKRHKDTTPPKEHE